MALDAIFWTDIAASKLGGGWHQRVAKLDTPDAETAPPFVECWAAYRSLEPSLREPRALSQLLRRGVPAELRPQVWSRCLGLDEVPHVVTGELQEPPHWAVQLIDVDVPRTFSTWAAFQEANGPAKLRRALLAFAAENPDIGYCQSLNFVAGVFAMVMESEQAVPASMHRLLEVLVAREWYAEGMRQLHADALVLKDLMREHTPILSGALQAHGFEPLFVCPRWFLSMFAVALEGEGLLRIWDVVVHDGIEAVFRVALALLARREDDIVRASSLEDLLEMLMVPQAGVDVDTLLAIAYHPDLRLNRPQIEHQRQQAVLKLRSGGTASSAVESAKALAPYLLARYTRGVMAQGREWRGGEPGGAYRVGDFTRGLVSKSRGLLPDGGVGDVARELVAKISAMGRESSGAEDAAGLVGKSAGNQEG